MTINSTYLFGTVHVAQNLTWTYFSTKILQILNESNQVWVEHDFTDPDVSKHIYGCSIEKLSIKQQARLRAKTWSQFLNETNTSNGSFFTREKWRKWFINNQFSLHNYLWRNKTIVNDTILDHRIILEAYQRGVYVGSLEPIPNDCLRVRTFLYL